MKRIKLGLPKGSLNTIGRGNTESLFIDAGYDIRGYTPQKESDSSLRIVNDPEILPFLTRPQSAPNELRRGLLDIAIIGDDWVAEESINSEELLKLCDLDYGKTRIVTAVPKELDVKNLADFFLKNKGNQIICYTEYVNLTRRHFMENEGYKAIYGDAIPLIQIRGIRDGDNDLVQIINSDGVTEGYITKGADIIVDNTQTGATLKEYGLRELDVIMESSAGLFGSPMLKKDAWKSQKAEDIKNQLLGVVVGRGFYDVKFNIPKDKFESLLKYLKANRLFAQSPTVSEAGDWYAVNIVIPKEQWPRISIELKRDHQASAIVRSELKQFIA
jgi:ATP phosphoribosyltransferase-like protein